jgi:hypothetical protein
LQRKSFEQIEALIEEVDLPVELQGVYRCLKNFFGAYESETLTVDDLANLFFASRPKDREFYQALFANLKTIEASGESVQMLCKALKRARIQRTLAEKYYEASEGKQEAYKAAKALYAELELLDAQPDDAPGEFQFVTQDLSTLISRTMEKPGLRWRLNSLNRNLGSLRKGNFGFIFARPETGKTTFLCSEATFMAEQLADDAGPIIHLNNEQGGDEVQLRYYQAALGCTMEQLLGNMPAAQKQWEEKTKGKLQVYDSGQIHRKQVEKLCEIHKPSLIIYDQIDKIHGFDADREDLRLGSIYIWARELAKSYCPAIGVCQADGTGEGVKWLTMAHVANAKTSKQAEADWILGIGKTADPGYEKLRFLQLSKNKLMGDKDTDPKMRHGKWECLIDTEVGRYRDFNN